MRSLRARPPSDRIEPGERLRLAFLAFIGPAGPGVIAEVAGGPKAPRFPGPRPAAPHVHDPIKTIGSRLSGDDLR
jgi:hypothetical protein